MHATTESLLRHVWNIKYYLINKFAPENREIAKNNYMPEGNSTSYSSERIETNISQRTAEP